MSVTIKSEAPAFYEDSTGALRVGTSRVLLELVLRAFQDGATPERIVQMYETTNLADVYSVISYYLRHREEMDDYLDLRERMAEEVKQRIDEHQGDLAEIRERLLARRNR